MNATRTGPSPGTGDTTRHRALGSASRVGILHLLRRRGAMTAREVAGSTGLHLTTAREHLDRLAGAGLLRRTRAADGTPGRPAWRYTAVDGTDPDPAAGPYRQMATALVEHLVRTDADPQRTATAVGTAWGRDIAAAHRTGRRPIAALTAILDDLGFAPRTLPSGAADRPGAPGAADRPGVPGVPGSPGVTVLHLHSCPFLDLAVKHPRVICGLHHGVVRGALAGLGATATSTDLEPFGAPTACVVRLTTAEQ